MKVYGWTYDAKAPAAACRALLLALVASWTLLTCCWIFSPQALAARTQQRADTLLTSIADANKGASSAWYVMGLSACGLGKTADAQTLLEETVAAVKAGKTTDATQLQRNVIALTAAGYDASKLASGGKTYDAVAALAPRASSLSPVNVKISTLLAYASGGYEPAADAALGKDALIASVISAQHADGGFAYGGSATDADMTALAICALQPYAAKSAAAAEAVVKAKKALLATQLSDGSFPSQGQKAGNANSTAFAVVALCALGVDPSQPLGGGVKTSPLDALLAFATEGLDGFEYAGKANALATEQGFRALIACKGFAAAGGAYNIYTCAAKGSAVFERVDVPAATKKKASSKKKSTKKNAAKKVASSSAKASSSGSSGGTPASSASNPKAEATADNSDQGSSDGDGQSDVEFVAPEDGSACVPSTESEPEPSEKSPQIPLYLIAGLVVGCAGLACAVWLFTRREEGEKHGE